MILVGAVLTVATSFFANKAKNLASNPKAAGSCSQGIRTHGKTSETCSTICGNYDNYWPNSQWTEGTIRYCCCKGSNGVGILNIEAGEEGCYCKNLKREDGIFQGTCNNGLSCNPNTGKCFVYKPTTSNTPTAVTPRTTPVSAGSGPYDLGTTVVGENQKCCFKKKGKIYVFATYESMVNNDMLDADGNPDCKRQSDAVVRSYQAENPPGAFICSGSSYTGQSEEDFVNQYNTEHQTPTSTTPLGGDIKSANEVCGFEDDCVEGYICVVVSPGPLKPHTGGRCVKKTTQPSGAGTPARVATPGASAPTPTYTPIPTLPNQLNATQDNLTCRNNPNIKYCVKCVSINTSVNQCASFEYYKKGCSELIGTSSNDLDKYCSTTPTTVKINYRIEASGSIPFGRETKCTYTPISLNGNPSFPITDTYSYLKISILKNSERIFNGDENIPNSFPVVGTTSVNTTTEGTFQLVVSYYKGYHHGYFNYCEPEYETFTGEGTVRHESSGDVVDLKVTLIGER
jgi:hypothetical protein